MKTPTGTESSKLAFAHCDTPVCVRAPGIARRYGDPSPGGPGAPGETPPRQRGKSLPRSGAVEFVHNEYVMHHGGVRYPAQIQGRIHRGTVVHPLSQLPKTFALQVFSRFCCTKSKTNGPPPDGGRRPMTRSQIRL